MSAEHTDQDLVNRCLTGDEEAWTTMSALIARLVGGLAATHWLDAGTQQDIVQEVLAILLHDQCRTLCQFGGRSRLSTFLATIVIRVAARLRHERGPLTVADPAILEESSNGTDGWTSSVEIRTVIRQTLSPTDLFILHLGVAGHTANEIADMLSRLQDRPWRAETVRQRRSRAIRRVRQALSEPR